MTRHLPTLVLLALVAACGQPEADDPGIAAQAVPEDAMGADDVRLPNDASATVGEPDAGTPTDAAGDDAAAGCQWDTDCTDQGLGCMTGLCHPDLGCLLAPRPDGIACDDGNPCTNGGVCVSGDCKHGVPRNCDDKNPCTFDWCREHDGKCVHSNTVDGGPCAHADGCVAAATCSKGKCTPTGQSWCDCSEDKHCDKFDDGNLCNGIQYCDKAHFPWLCKAKPGSVVTCNSASDTDCAKASCAADTGKCYVKFSDNGAACSDGEACTVGDSCADGACKPQQDNCGK